MKKAFLSIQRPCSLAMLVITRGYSGSNGPLARWVETGPGKGCVLHIAAMIISEHTHPEMESQHFPEILG